MRWVFKGYQLEGHTEICGIPISIENRAGSFRRGIDCDGNPWVQQLTVAYGKIPYAVGADGDSIDVFIGPYPTPEKVFIVQINKKNTDKYDEDKVFLGFEKRIDAFRCFQANYKNWRAFYRDMHEVSIHEFRTLIATMRSKRATADQVAWLRGNAGLVVKGYIKPHSMTTKSGRIVPVAGHWDKRTKKMDAKPGDEYQFKLPDNMYGKEGRKTKVKVEKADDKDYVVTWDQHGIPTRMPKESLRHFLNDLSGRVEVARGGVRVPEIKAVITGKGEFLGKGDDGIVFKVGDRAVKVSTTVPYHPGNPGHRTPEFAADMLRKQTEMAEEMKRAGVPFIPEVKYYRFGDKGFQVRDLVDVPKQFTERQLESIREAIGVMHKAGYAMNDDIQPGLDKAGNPVFYDTGKAGKLPQNDRERSDRIESDMSSLKRLYRASGVPFIPSYDASDDPEGDYESMMVPELQEFYVTGDAVEDKAHRTRLRQLRDYMIARYPESQKTIDDRWLNTSMAHMDAAKKAKK